jgi:hypothetical protein
MNKRFSFLLSAPLLFVACSSNTVTPVGVAPDGGGGDPDAGITDGPGGGTLCSSARDQLLGPVDKTSTATVTILSDENGKKTIYVDASVGGPAGVKTNARVYLDLGAGTRVSVTDKSAVESKDWDLALKRYVVYTNSGDGGPGTGGAVQLSKPFASVTAADVTAATPVAESFFDADCNAKLDPTQAPATTFAEWYDYENTIPTPKPVTYVVRGGTGRLYKVGIKAYDALPDGGSRANMSTGFFVLEVTEVP